MELIWEQEAAGSNPAIPTQCFEYVVGHLKQARPVCRCWLMPVGVARRRSVAVHLWLPRSPAIRPALLMELKFAPLHMTIDSVTSQSNGSRRHG
jgi:hypothetical protein